MWKELLRSLSNWRLEQRADAIGLHLARKVRSGDLSVSQADLHLEQMTVGSRQSTERLARLASEHLHYYLEEWMEAEDEYGILPELSFKEWRKLKNVA